MSNFKINWINITENEHCNQEFYRQVAIEGREWGQVGLARPLQKNMYLLVLYLCKICKYMYNKCQQAPPPFVWSLNSLWTTMFASCLFYIILLIRKKKCIHVAQFSFCELFWGYRIYTKVKIKNNNHWNFFMHAFRMFSATFEIIWWCVNT